MASTTHASSSADITSVLSEERLFTPSAQFAKDAYIGSFARYKSIYKSSIRNPEKFWPKAPT